MNYTKILILIFAFLISGNLISQIIEIKVRNENNVNVADFSIFLNSHFVVISEGFKYTLKANEFDSIWVKKDNLVTDFYIVENRADTVKVEFNLHPKIKEIEEVTVVYEKYKKVAGETNENVIDYIVFPQDQSILIIKSFKSEYYLELISEINFIEQKLNFKPERLFLDIFGNSHVLSKDSAYQLVMDSSFIFISKISKKLFIDKIQPLVYKSAENIFYENLTLHNKCYLLTMTDTLNHVKVVKKIYDKIGYKVAEQEYNKIISSYFKEVPEERNIILNGIWNGDLINLAESSDLVAMITWYLNISNNEIACSSFGQINDITTVNLMEKSLTKYNHNGVFINEIPLKVENLKNEKLIYDFFYDKIYLFGAQNNSKILFIIDDKIGEAIPIVKLNNIQPDKIKVLDNKVYFLIKNKAGFSKLFFANFIQ
jgi:hypothetical protein